MIQVKTVRVNMETFVYLMEEKHKQEMERRDVVNMSDVLDVVMLKLKAYQEGKDVDEVESMKFRFTDKADVGATVIVGEDDDDEDEDEEEEAPRPKRKKSTAAAKKKRKRVSE